MKKLLGQILWVVTAVGALNWGLSAMGWGLFQFRFLYSIPFLVTLLQYAIGLSGAASLYMYFTDNTCK